MIPDNVNVSDARVQSFGFRFDFITSPDKLIVQATCSKDNEKYVGQIPVNPYTDFQYIKKILEDGDFKTLTKTENLLKIRIGATVIQLNSTSKFQIKEMKETLQISLDKQFELQDTIKIQNKKIKEHEFMIYDLRKTVEEMKSSPKVSVTVLQEIKTLVNDKFNEMNKNAKNQANKKQNQFSQNTLMIKKQQDFIKQILNQFSQIKHRVNLIENEMKISEKDVQKLRTIHQEVQDCLTTKIIDFAVTEKNHEEEIKDIKKNFNEKTERNRTAIENISIKIDKFSITEQKVNELKFELNGRLMNLKKSILTIEEIGQIIQEKKKYIEVKKKKQIEETMKMWQLTQKLAPYYRWSQQLKHNDLVINQNLITLNKNNWGFVCSLLQVGFTNEVKYKQCWGIKIKKFDYKSQYINVGICLKNVVQKKKFHFEDVKWGETGHGCYFIDGEGKLNPYQQNKFNIIDKSKHLKEDDVIFMEYDPIEWKLRFQINQNGDKVQMKIPPLPQGDAYHPFVSFYNYQPMAPQSVQLIDNPSNLMSYLIESIK